MLWFERGGVGVGDQKASERSLQAQCLNITSSLKPEQGLETYLYRWRRMRRKDISYIAVKHLWNVNY